MKTVSEVLDSISDTLEYTDPNKVTETEPVFPDRIMESGGVRGIQQLRDSIIEDKARTRLISRPPLRLLDWSDIYQN